MNEPVVDILMPTYKPDADHLRAALDSALNQTEQRWRMIICDEPTEIDTEALVKQHTQDERIRVFRNEKRLGIGGNWNRCLSKATAPYVQYLFQDDLWETDYLAKAISILETHHSVGMVSMNHVYLLEGNTPANHLYAEVEKLRGSIARGHHDGLEFLLWWMERGLHPNIPGEPSFVMLRRATMQQAGKFREDMQQNLDSEYWARMLRYGDWHFHYENSGTFRVHAAAASAQNFESGAGMFDRLRVLRSTIQLLPAEHRGRAKLIMKMQMKKMAAKFLERFAGKSVQIEEKTPLPLYLLCHPVLTLRAAYGFLRTKGRTR